MAKTTIYYLFLCILPTILTSVGKAQSPAHPFPQHVSYTRGAILPGHISRRSMDDSVRLTYERWKKRYIRAGCNKGEYYVWFESSKKSENKLCVSEGQGYGMLITALMAGYDAGARTTFDGLLLYAHNHASKRSPALMAWAQKKNCTNVDGSTAPDGDIDIAYSLLLAAAQWGENGPVNYRKEALRTITAISRQEINAQTGSVVLSNSIDPDGGDYADTRTSDFMPAHFKAFFKSSGDPVWKKVIDNNYSLFGWLQQTYSPRAGLVPDFVNNVSITPAIHATPAKPHYLESSHDGHFYFNACRVPWRVATDYLCNGDRRAFDFLQKFNAWIRHTTGDNPDNISAGYNLAGEDLPRHNFEALCFIAPIAVSAMIDSKNQAWLDKCWNYLTSFPARQFDYYDNSIRLIDMIILSGNYWTP